MRRIFLITLISLNIVGCAGLPKFPDISKWYANTKEEKATELYLKDPVNFIYVERETKPLEVINGMYCMSATDEARIAEWVQKVKTKYEELKQCNKNGN